MRVFIAMLSHETNTFSTLATDRRSSSPRVPLRRRDPRGVSRHRHLPRRHDRRRRRARRSRCCRRSPRRPRPPGRVTQGRSTRTRRRASAPTSAAARPALDGVLLDLHGAMVPEHVDDGEGDLLRRRARDRRPGRPDRRHARLPRQRHGAMVRHATLLHGYKTYPHVDMAERGREAAERLADVARRPHPPDGRVPAAAPCCRRSRASARRAARCAGSTTSPTRWSATRACVTVSVFAGLPARRHPRRRAVHLRRDQRRRRARRRLADRLESRRVGASPRVRASRGPRARGGRRGARVDEPPVVLADIADNTGGGAAGDGTEILRELLRVERAERHRRRASGIPRPRRRARAPGVGATLTLDVGGKVDDRHGAPVDDDGPRARAERRQLRAQGPDAARAARAASARRRCCRAAA